MLLVMFPYKMHIVQRLRQKKFKKKFKLFFIEIRAVKMLPSQSQAEVNERTKATSEL